jgi:hypothetical protein
MKAAELIFRASFQLDVQSFRFSGFFQHHVVTNNVLVLMQGAIPWSTAALTGLKWLKLNFGGRLF